uniref:Uncharacterized protein n=1 Tax=Stomoxys calcitrans TaxID=35570 RepID=A0A1I8NME5_STOCA
MSLEVKINEKKIKNSNSAESANWLAIFKGKKFEEQLKLAKQGNAHMQLFFEGVIWPIDYSLLLNIDESEGYFIVRNESDTRRLVLKAEAFQEFLSYYAAKVRSLILGPALDVQLFPNLISLKCSIRHISIGDFLMRSSLAEHLTVLECLHLKELDMECGATTLDDQVLAKLLEIGNLKCLRLDFFFATKISFKQFCELVFSKRLKSLEGNFEISECDQEPNMPYIKLTKSIRLKSLQITTTCDPAKWSVNNFSLHREIFENLLKLTIKFTEEPQDDLLADFFAPCKCLETLTLTGTNFCNIKIFALPPTLRELHFKWCRGLNCLHLKQILSQTSGLKEFFSSNTKIEGKFENFKISPSIEALKIERVDMCEFSGVYDCNESLKHLTWYHTKNCQVKPAASEQLGQASGIDEESFDITPTNQMILSAKLCLGSCTNLETLDMGHKLQMPLNILVQMKNLRKLNTWIVDHTSGQWLYITALLQHPSLRELNITFVRTVTELSLERFRTNVTALHVQDFNFCDSGLEYFLELFSNNPQLQLSFLLPPLAFVKPLRSLLNHRKFPHFLKTLEIYGFTIDCSELRTNFYATMKKFKFVRNVFEENLKDSIILSTSLQEDLKKLNA